MDADDTIDDTLLLLLLVLLALLFDDADMECANGERIAAGRTCNVVSDIDERI